jgi:hypothetical protein
MLRKLESAGRPASDRLRELQDQRQDGDAKPRHQTHGQNDARSLAKLSVIGQSLYGSAAAFG